jgi:hypothetical protein
VLLCKGRVEAPANVRAPSSIDDEVTQRAVGDVTLEVGPKRAGLGEVGAVLLPKTP